MAFVRRKVSRGSVNYVLVENKREGGKVRQRVLLHLGTSDECSTLTGAEKHTAERLEKLREEIAESEDRLASRRQTMAEKAAERRDWYAERVEEYKAEIQAAEKGESSIYEPDDAEWLREDLEGDEADLKALEKALANPPSDPGDWPVRLGTWNQRYNGTSFFFCFVDEYRRAEKRLARLVAELEALEVRLERIRSYL